ncbi:MAG TPA: low molecular weight protein arginine phosphatase [Firmicutes bacterium]|nr:low molecular weight protein arginine phosphatase [Bacillota bacterium]
MEETVRILFVCTGNTCRSVMAQGFFQKMWDNIADKKINVKACSAGVSAFDGISASPDALEILHEEGIDLSEHRSRKLIPEMVNEANYLYTMTKEQKNFLLANYPEAFGKIFQLNELLEEGEKKNIKDIADPIGQGIERYRAVAEEIKKALAIIIEDLMSIQAEDKPRDRDGNNN